MRRPAQAPGWAAPGPGSGKNRRAARTRRPRSFHMATVDVMRAFHEQRGPGGVRGRGLAGCEGGACGAEPNTLDMGL